MALATRCPHCLTTFRVANDQLKLHAGLVRCGSCQQTFNGVEHLIALDVAKTAARPVTNSESQAVPVPPITTERQVEPASAEEHKDAVDSFSDDAFSADTFPIIPPNLHENSPVADLPVEHNNTHAQTVQAPAETEVVTESQPGSAASLDFLFGDDESDTLIHPETPDATLAAKVELDTKAVILDPADASWSVSDTPDHQQQNADLEARHELHQKLEGMQFSTEADDNELHEPNEAHDPHEPYIGEAEAALAQHAALAEDSVSESSADMAAEDKPEFVIKAEREQKRGRLVRIGMLLSCLFLAPLLMLQAVYIFRVQIAANLPESKAPLVQVCGILHCKIELPAQIEHITLESNELQSLIPDGNVFSLVMQLQNNSTTLQSWPYVELVLNDERDKAVLQKAFTPAQYLTDKASLTKGFAPKTQQNIKIYFELPKLKASGYHVSIFYP